MNQSSHLTKILICICTAIVFAFSMSGCATLPKNVLLVGEKHLENRHIQIRKYDTTNLKEIVLASAGVLQDLGFTIENTDTDLGILVASKDRTAVDAGQVALATTAVLLSALGGQTSRAFENIDDVQKITVSVVTSPGLSGQDTAVRTNFQRMVWNKAGNVNRIESIDDVDLYQRFYDKLSQSVFLEANKI